MSVPYSRTLADALLEQAERAPERLAAVCNGQEITYSSLVTRARLVAAGLRRREIRRGDRVGVLFSNGIEWLELCFGINAIGAIVVPFSTWSTKDELDHLLADSQIKLLVTLDRFGRREYSQDLMHLVPESIAEPGGWYSGRYPLLREIVVAGENVPTCWTRYEDFVSEALPVERLPPGEGPSANDDALILYTSGSTARPKAVRLVNYALIENGFNIGERQGLTCDDRVLLSPPLFWSYGSANALPATLTHGAALILQPRFEPAEALDLIERWQCTALYTLPSMTNAIVRHPTFSRQRTRTLRTGLTIGSPIDVRVAAETLGATHVCNIYGLTETYGNCCVTSWQMPLDQRAESQGPPLPGVRIRILHSQTGQVLGAGEEGEVEVFGFTTPGYAGASEADAQSVILSDGYFRTGDRGAIDSSGYFHFTGRRSEMIKRSGINVSPAEVESVLQRHPSVGQAAVVGAPSREYGEVIVAFVVTTDDAIVDGDELRAHCRAWASSYKVPDRIEVIDSLPLTPTGKLLRSELKNRAAILIRQCEEPGER